MREQLSLVTAIPPLLVHMDVTKLSRLSSRTGIIQFYLIVVCVSLSHGLQFSLNKTSDGGVCDQVECLANRNVTDKILSIVGLVVYDVTQADFPVKVASASSFAPGVQLEQVKGISVTVTGNISGNHAQLVLHFRNQLDCLYRSFLCELDFVHVNGETEVVTQTLMAERKPTLPNGLNSLVKLAADLQTFTNGTERKLAELLHRTEVIERKLDTVSSQLFKPKCARGAPARRPREIIQLWDGVVTLCDTITDGGGWVVVQRRTKGDINFTRNWEDYKLGFGTPDTDFWIGNDAIHNLTSQGYNELQTDLIYQGRRYYARYSHFNVADELSKYQLTVSGYRGTAGDSLTEHSGLYFSTVDSDNDYWSGNCAQSWSSGWWYNNCYKVDLNGVWADNNRIYWSSLGATVAPTLIEIKVRRSFYKS